MYKDRLILATFAGVIAALLANLTLYAINLMIPGDNINMPQLTVEIFLNIENYDFIHKLLGTVWSTIIGGSYALAYLIALDLSGWNNMWLKAIIVVSGLWLLGAGFMINLIDLGHYVRDEPLSILAFFVAHLLFATYLYLLIKSFGKEK